MFYFMKRNLLFLMLGLSSFLFFSCSSMMMNGVEMERISIILNIL